MDPREPRAPGHDPDAAGGACFAIYTPGGPAPRLPGVAPEALDEFFWSEDEDGSRAAAARASAPAAREEKRRWLTFAVGDEEYALEIERVREILKPPAITEVPRAPAHVIGVITVRGEVIAVFDARPRLGLPPRATDRAARVIICDAGEGPCGLLVDDVRNVVRLPPSAIEPRPQGVGGPAAELIAGLARDRERLLVLLDLPLLFRARGAEEA